EFLRETARIMRGRGAGDLGHVLDLPAQPPQWQHFPDRRHDLLTRVGFTVMRETLRFAWNAHDPLPTHPERLTYRSVAEAGEEAFLEALERVSTGSLDQRDQAERAEYGARQAARNLLGLLQGLEYDPEWWQLGYTRTGDLVGLVLPAGTPRWGTIGYIGVVPEQRGRGSIDDLLARGTRVLATGGVVRIEADTDVANVPMANAFRRGGYTQFARRHEYQWRNAP
ncbi:MAG TPA: hypothetical protein VER55_04040, partial [Ardenticatenaceae bacterium]|nr:hypothetical protein [Ardenticatenaceae bacterium]